MNENEKQGATNEELGATNENESSNGTTEEKVTLTKKELEILLQKEGDRRVTMLQKKKKEEEVKPELGVEVENLTLKEKLNETQKAIEDLKNQVELNKKEKAINDLLIQKGLPLTYTKLLLPIESAEEINKTLEEISNSIIKTAEDRTLGLLNGNKPDISNKKQVEGYSKRFEHLKALIESSKN